MKRPATAKRGTPKPGTAAPAPRHHAPTHGSGKTPKRNTTSDPDRDASHPADPAATSEPPASTPPDTLMFGSSLEPVLLKQCDGRLSHVAWFRTDWQRGGALTGYASWHDDQNQPHDVVVKLPIPPRERDWLVRLSGETSDRHNAPSVTPRVFAHGNQLNGYDLAWVVMEKLPHGPLGTAWHGTEFDLLVDAAGLFYAAADATALPDEPTPEPNDWEALLRLGRDKVKTKSWPQGQAWKAALKQAGKKLDGWLDTWNQRPRTGWCHGDLHLGNAMSRTAPPPEASTPGSQAGAEARSKEAPGCDSNETCANAAVLLDLANVRPGHWVEDAVYCEHLYWSVPDRLAGRKLVSLIAKARRAHGLEVGDDWSALADVKRKLLAMAAPATLGHEGAGPAHLDAALARLG